jgi:hypothetical protein
MRTFRRVCDELDITSMPAKMLRMACPDRIESTTSISGPRGLWRDFFKRTGDARRRNVRRSVVASRTSGNIGTSSVPDTCPNRGWSTRTPSPSRGGPPYWWQRSWPRSGRSGPWRVQQERDGPALPWPTGAEESVTSAWPAHLLRGGRALQPAGASTPLGGSSGELPRTYSGSSGRVDY